MCCPDNPLLPREANKAKCFAVACFIFSILSMLSLFGGVPGIINFLCGLLACVGSCLLLCCCAPKTTDEGPCKFTAAAVLLLIAGILEVIMFVVQIIFAILLTQVDENHYCSDRYKECDRDYYGYRCDKYCNTRCVGTSGRCDEVTTCVSTSVFEDCEDVNGKVRDAVKAWVVVVVAVAGIFTLIAGILNIICGALCFKAKAAVIRAKSDVHAPQPPPATPVAVAVAVAPPVAMAAPNPVAVAVAPPVAMAAPSPVAVAEHPPPQV
eukprot:CAMPEP_0119058898 /NCGR_PEP_ID=MMETSP1178-20130426/3151_1 /TAXON_ID=33656 /ORGANISM="unid sp, Strain CCMP2000" /LENGTH=265 /DNA_ID=CAMNT_0007039887 /DNA_START=46 /DNA_END=843 /DNA_ORIENTATION=-